MERVRRATGSERAPSFFTYNRGVHILVYILSTLFILLAAGLLFAYVRDRRPGMLLMAAAYGTSAGAALALMAWWPLVVGFLVAWVFRLIGLEPGSRNKSRS
jgi:pheromone shutdown protein TraB